MAQTRMICTCCGKEKELKRDYYSSHSPFHKSTGRMHICKVCFLEYVDEDTDKLKIALRMVDRPFSQEIFKSTQDEIESTGKSLIGSYMKNLGLRQNRSLTWDDSDFEGHTSSEKISHNDMYKEAENEMTSVNKEDLKYLMSFWGKGFDIEDYIWLQTEYEDFTNRYECDSKGMELLIKQICLTQLDIEKRRIAGEKVDQQLKTLQDLLGSSNLKPVQETGANAVEQESFGTLIKKFEKEKPIPKPDPGWLDVDGIGKYIRSFFLGPMSKAVGAENKYQDEYEEELKKFTVDQDTFDEGDY